LSAGRSATRDTADPARGTDLGSCADADDEFAELRPARDVALREKNSVGVNALLHRLDAADVRGVHVAARAARTEAGQPDIARVHDARAAAPLDRRDPLEGPPLDSSSCPRTEWPTRAPRSGSARRGETVLT
jgi:hypothetical protein